MLHVMTMPSETLTWPSKPYIHDRERMGGEGHWREPRLTRRDESDPYVTPFRTCYYCGSMHPEDLYRILAPQEKVEDYYGVGIHVGGSDWKYGWPHKFYINHIPNPVAGAPLVEYTYCSDIEGRSDSDEWESVEAEWGTSYRRVSRELTCPRYTHAKFYNEHLAELLLPAFVAVTVEIYKHTSIAFTKTSNDVLHYSAPYYNYQH